MTSERLRRFNADDPPRVFGNQSERDRIAQDTADFLARGGTITVYDSADMARPTYGFNLGDRQRRKRKS